MQSVVLTELYQGRCDRSFGTGAIGRWSANMFLLLSFYVSCLVTKPTNHSHMVTWGMGTVCTFSAGCRSM